ncbi:carotenoid oxygenase family protein [Thalassotalea fusca]
MHRRQILKSLTMLGASSILLKPSLLNAFQTKTPDTNIVNVKELFNQALAYDPSLIGFADIDNNFNFKALSIEGKIPVDLQGWFYRNGPAKHERQDIRYQHLFEGDGMIQEFAIFDGKVQHRGKFIDTPKFDNEQAAKRFLYSGPDTKLANSLPVSSADAINTANTNVIAVGDDLWALWEAGSPSLLDTENLAFKQHVSLGEGSQYGNTLNGLPFSAHPKVESNGEIWNFGLDRTGNVIVYHLTATGRAKNVGIINARYYGGMLHDFLITQNHVLLILPSLIRKASDTTVKQGYFNQVTYNDTQAMRVVVVNKSDLTVKREYELTPGFAFHFGNAWETADGTIYFDASLYPNADIIQTLGNVMRGQKSMVHPNAQTTLFTLHPSGKTTQSNLAINSEFPRICSHLVGKRNKMVYFLSSRDSAIWSDSVCALNTDTGKIDRYDFGENYLVEEHIPVCPQFKEGTGYLIGTALHVPTKRTCLNVFVANNLSAGPIAKAWLPYHLPLGFHGNFKAAS